MESPRCEGNLFNDAVIVRDPAYLPYIAAALTPARVGEYYGRVLEQAGPLPVDLFSVPVYLLLNFVVMNSMDGGAIQSISACAPRKFRPPCREARL